MNTTFNDFVDLVKSIYPNKNKISLHEPLLDKTEIKHISNCINSSYVSSIGKEIIKFEKKISKFMGIKYGIATVNGTSALHSALLLLNVKRNDEVLIQSLTFIAPCNAIKYCGADPVFMDVEKETLGICPDKLEFFLSKNIILKKDGYAWNKQSRRRVKACVVVHNIGHPSKVKKIAEILKKYQIDLIEDCAESLGSFINKKHTGMFSKIATLSFNGNKIITTGGGGMILTNNKKIADKSRSLVSTGKIKNIFNNSHNMIAYNYRMPNLNASLGLSQFTKLNKILVNKRIIANKYKKWSYSSGFEFIDEPYNSKSNFWMNSIICENKKQRDEFFKFSINKNIQTRQIWKPIHQLQMYKTCYSKYLENTENLCSRILSLPSSCPSIKKIDE